MKPTSQFTLRNRRYDSFVTGTAGSSLPQTDFFFQPPTDFPARSRGDGAPHFRSIGAEYFGGEARSHFAAEAIVFGVIVLSAAVPVFEAVRGLVQYVYGGL